MLNLLNVGTIKRYEGTVIAITRSLFLIIKGWILEIEWRALPFEGNYSNWLIAKEKRMSLENKNISRKSYQKELNGYVKVKGQQKKASFKIL